MANRYADESDIQDFKVYGLSSSVVSNSVTNAFIASAEAVIDSYLSKKYSLPLLTTTVTYPLLTTLAADLGTANILESFYMGESQNINNWVETKRKNAIEILERIAKGTMEIVDSTGATVAKKTSSYFRNSNSGYTPTFEIDDDTSWARSQSRLDAIDDDREGDD